MAYINATHIKEQVSILALLNRLGYRHLKTSGKEFLYLSPLRDSDTKPSFTVNDEMGVWYDHGLGRGGNIIDFGLAYWKGCTFQEVLEKIMVTTDAALVQSGQVTEPKNRKRSAVKIPHYQVEEIKDLGNNPAITGYLQSRGIWQAAQDRVKEVYYYVEDNKKLQKHFFAAGWQNELGSWEVRNKYFHCCIGHKAITFIPNDSESLSIFEGYTDYLSWLTENPLSADSVLVMNSTAMILPATIKAKEFAIVNLYFDMDKTGHRTSLDFIKAVPQATDCSQVYKGHNDYNDKLVAELKRSYISR